MKKIPIFLLISPLFFVIPVLSLRNTNPISGSDITCTHVERTRSENPPNRTRPETLAVEYSQLSTIRTWYPQTQSKSFHCRLLVSNNLSPAMPCQLPGNAAPPSGPSPPTVPTSRNTYRTAKTRDLFLNGTRQPGTRREEQCTPVGSAGLPMYPNRL